MVGFELNVRDAQLPQPPHHEPERARADDRPAEREDADGAEIAEEGLRVERVPDSKITGRRNRKKILVSNTR